MAKPTREVPDQVQRAASMAWEKWRGRFSGAASANGTSAAVAGRSADPDAGKSPEERMISKIKRRMQEYPEWYETDPSRLSASVCAELERIGAILDKALPDTTDAIEVWQVPLSTFNWLVDDGNGERFVRGAISAWPDARSFNAANSRTLDGDERARLRAPFQQIAPPLLKAVLEQLLEEDLLISFAQRYVGPEFKYLVLRIQVPEAS